MPVEGRSREANPVVHAPGRWVRRSVTTPWFVPEVTSRWGRKTRRACVNPGARPFRGSLPGSDRVPVNGRLPGWLPAWLHR